MLNMLQIVAPQLHRTEHRHVRGATLSVETSCAAQGRWTYRVMPPRDFARPALDRTGPPAAPCHRPIRANSIQPDGYRGDDLGIERRAKRF